MLKVYKEENEIQESGVFFSQRNNTFDLWHVKPARTGSEPKRSLITRIPQTIALAGEVTLDQAMQQITAFERRLATA